MMGRGITMSLFFCLGTLFATTEQQRGVHLLLNNKTFSNNSVISITEIGKTNSVSQNENHALQCITDKRPCCKSGFTLRVGEWYFPNGTVVPVEGEGTDMATNFYRNRGEDDGTVNLNRVSPAIVAPTGLFCCEVPNSSNITQRVCANIQHYNSSVASSTSPEEGGSGYSVATVIISVGITISSITIFGIVLLVIIAFLLLRHVKKSRFPTRYQYPPSALQYTARKINGENRPHLAREEKEATCTKQTANKEYSITMKHSTTVTKSLQPQCTIEDCEYENSLSTTANLTKTNNPRGGFRGHVTRIQNENEDDYVDTETYPSPPNTNTGIHI